MDLGLVESQRRLERHGRGMASSVVVHAVVIGLAWYGTAGAIVRSGPEIVASMPLPPLAPAHPTPTSGRSGASGGIAPAPTIPTRLPPIPVGPVTVRVPDAPWDSLVAAPNDWGSGRHADGRSGSQRPGTGEVFRTVDVMAVPEAGNPAPVYPTMLRDAGVEGSISAQFVVDSTGRVAAPSITFLDGGNALFQQSVRRALEGARFSPALVDGRAVRVLMAQTFQFRLRR